MKHQILVILVFCAMSAFAQKETKPETTPAGTVVYNYTHKKGPRITYGTNVLIHAHTWLNDSLVQSTRRDYGGPREFTLPDSIAMSQRTIAVFDGLRMLTNGDSATILQTVDSIMAKQIPAEFGVVKVIRYEVNVVDVLSPEELAKREKDAEAKRKNVQAKEAEVGKVVAQYLSDYNAGKLKKKLKKTSSGLEYVIIKQGKGARVKEGDKLATHYYGVLKADGVMFDNSYSRGESIKFEVGTLIPGFNEGMTLVNAKGGKVILFIPYKLGYGEEGNGPIPPSADLVFYISYEDN